MCKTAGRECNGDFILSHGNTRMTQTHRNMRGTQRKAEKLNMMTEQKAWTYKQTKSRRGRGAGGERRRNTGEGSDWKNTNNGEMVLIGWKDTEEGGANEGETVQA